MLVLIEQPDVVLVNEKPHTQPLFLVRTFSTSFEHIPIAKRALSPTQTSRETSHKVRHPRYKVSHKDLEVRGREGV